jgi:hypothetical protein
MPIVTTNSLGMAMVLIPPGDLPLHGGGTTPIAGPFRMGACEVTVGQFRAFVKAKNYRTTPEAGNGGMTMHTGTPAPDPNANWEKPGVPTSDEHPVTQVAYPDAAAFCEWLSAQENAKYRLPTLKEWRWACKAGSHAAYYFGDDAKLANSSRTIGASTTCSATFASGCPISAVPRAESSAWPRAAARPVLLPSMWSMPTAASKTGSPAAGWDFGWCVKYGDSTGVNPVDLARR